MGNIENKERETPILRFDIKSFLIFLLIFVIEVLIALFVRDAIIRPYGGDLLVVVLIYYFVKSFVRIRPLYLSIVVLLFAYVIEIGQCFDLVGILGMQNNKIMRVVIGSSFSWGDMIAYTLGAILCYLVDREKSYK